MGEATDVYCGEPGMALHYTNNNCLQKQNWEEKGGKQMYLTLFQCSKESMVLYVHYCKIK